MYKVEYNNGSKAIEKSNEDWILDDKTIEHLDFEKLSKHEVLIKRNNKEYTVRVHNFNREEKSLILFINGKRHQFRVKEPIDLFLSKIGIDTFAKAKIKNIKAPMPGLILKLLVQEGDEVNAGDPLLILEAMKMENVFKAPDAVKIKSILISQGQAVDKNQELILFE